MVLNMPHDIYESKCKQPVLIKHYAMQDAEAVMEELHTSLTPALDQWRWYVSCPS
jgi:hypothetical protein